MTTDSENNMMNQLFSLHSIGGGRFFLFILLILNFQIVQAVHKDSEDYSSDAPSSSDILFISEGTVVSGKEQVYIDQPAKEKVKKKYKRKSVSISGKKKQNKEENLSQPVKSSNKTILSFSRDTQSEKSLIAGSDNEKQIIRPSQHIMKFHLLGSENSMILQIYLLDRFLKTIYRNHGLSNVRFLKNFNRPPPLLYMAIM
ncbi:hypothetical protein MP477_04600 [Chryseobacterium sp. WG23]|uniref:hypothetical protein n=1 Tax=Chryseobacterium sp. WG23 TaxID=2926910 RepID=UPI00211E5013|nr:hypothetical protein [Chryseobacterium sp. WG23]MCQ9634231.1 hypothetical protein [Chryseobacterium sp. WG23]